MQQDEAIREALSLVKRSRFAMLGTNGEDGYPNIKAMFNMNNVQKLETDGLKTIWFSTNTSSRRVAQLKRDPRACVYFADFDQFKGLMLVGDIEALQDIESRQLLWNEDSKKFYPLGVTDPDYTVLRFTARWGNYYHALSNVTFEL
jgi:general stress protein 26